MRRILALGHQNGFTLLEVMITVTIIGVLMAIAIPNYISSRNNARTKTCLSNLQHIERAKEQLAAEDKLEDGESIAWGDLVPNLIKSQPVCPAGGTYTIGAVGISPKCSIEGHSLE
ncbi:MAG: prepilin-type N-terminal cleavage/methylation domain-containing protein [Armatimonadota bacterium]